ncbi:ChaN family lipoprotein [Myroides sp. LJL119]
MIKELEKNDVVLFGEFHNNSLIHWLELKVAKSLANKNKLVLGAEMFEADNQDTLSLYINKQIDEELFSNSVRLWPNYKTDYRGLVEFAKDNNLDFIATNIPRRYASLVYKVGEDSLQGLSELEKSWMAPLPFAFDPELPGYKKISEFSSGHQGENLAKAQAIKDATMAYFIGENFKNDAIFLHFNGAYHSNNFEGIVWYMNYYHKNLRIATISMVDKVNIEDFSQENLGLANFIIHIDADIIKTF